MALRLASRVAAFNLPTVERVGHKKLVHLFFSSMLRHVLAVIVRGSDGVLIRATVHTNYINHYTAYFYARCRTHHRPMGGWQCKMEAAKQWRGYREG